jgi:hypothetical protein
MCFQDRSFTEKLQSKSGCLDCADAALTGIAGLDQEGKMHGEFRGYGACPRNSCPRNSKFVPEIHFMRGPETTTSKALAGTVLS